MLVINIFRSDIVRSLQIVTERVSLRLSVKMLVDSKKINGSNVQTHIDAHICLRLSNTQLSQLLIFRLQQ